MASGLRILRSSSVNTHRSLIYLGFASEGVVRSYREENGPKRRSEKDCQPDSKSAHELINRVGR